jgi:nitroreductase
MRDAYDHIVRLRAVRDFESRPITEEDLRCVLDAGRWTGSSKNRQNWSFVVITDPSVKAEFATAGRFTNPVRNAPVAIALIQEAEGYEFDTGRLAQNMMLAADAVGLATCPVTLHDEDRAAEVLGLPDRARCRYGIAIGYPASGAGPSRFGGRKPLDELVHSNQYGGQSAQP